MNGCASHSIINRSPNPAWLKGLGEINMKPYRRFYRQKRHPPLSGEDGFWRTTSRYIINRP
jgi:hypothetical protein